jgi:hypothetical protein
MSQRGGSDNVRRNTKKNISMRAETRILFGFPAKLILLRNEMGFELGSQTRSRCRTNAMFSISLDGNPTDAAGLLIDDNCVRMFPRLHAARRVRK